MLFKVVDSLDFFKIKQKGWEYFLEGLVLRLTIQILRSFNYLKLQKQLIDSLIFAKQINFLESVMDDDNAEHLIFSKWC